jgi:glycosyltransferase involved in cell wall biosynthesis
MKVFLNRETVNGPYGGGNMFVKSFLELAPRFDVQVGTRLNQKYDAILLIDPRPDDVVGLGINDVLRYKLFQPKVKIFQRVNECDARKQTQGVDQMLAECGKNVDFTFFVSQWMREYHEKRNWPCVNSEVIYNGVDRNVFKPNKKFNNGKTNIVTSHWSDNIYKGHDVQKWLDEFVGKNSEKFTYTFIGRHQIILNTQIIFSHSLEKN